MSVCLEANSSTVLNQANSQVQQVVSGPTAAAVPPPAEPLPSPAAPPLPPSIGTQVTTSIKCTSTTGGSKVIVANAQSLTTSVTVTSGISGGTIVHHKQPVITVVNNPLALKGLPNAVAVAAPTFTLNPSVVKSTNSVTLANVPAATLVALTTSAGSIIANVDRDASVCNNNNNTEKSGPIHNVFVKKSSLVDGTTATAPSTGGTSTNIVTASQSADQQQQIPLSHKILTANTFPSNNVITNLNSTPVLKTTVNGQRPLNSSSVTPTTNKVKIISNVVMAPATQSSHPHQIQQHAINTNSTTQQLTVPQQQPQQLMAAAGPSHGKQQQHRYYQPAATLQQHQQHQQHATHMKHVQQLNAQQQQQHQQVVIGNGATKYLNSKAAMQGIIHSTNLGPINTATILNSSASMHPLHPSQQQQAPPPNQISLGERKMVYHTTATGAKNKNCHAAYKGPGAVQRTGAGLRTIPPQRPPQTVGGAVKTNYIGKHAVQAQRVKHTKAKATKAAALHPTYTGPIGQPSIHHPPSQHHPHTRQPPPTQLTFNQALTAQILETLGTDTPYKGMNHHHYSEQPQHHLTNSNSCQLLHQQQSSSMMGGPGVGGGMVSPPFASPPHYSGRQMYQERQMLERPHYQQRRISSDHQEQRHQQQHLLQQMMSSDEDHFTNLDKLSLVCQTVLLDHNYHIKSPSPDHPQSPPAIPNVVLPQNALIPPQLMSPTGPHCLVGLPQLPMPGSMGGVALLGQQQQQVQNQLNGLLTARERRNSRTELLLHHKLQQHQTPPLIHTPAIVHHHSQPTQQLQQHPLRTSISSSTTHNDNDDDAASDISDPGCTPFRPGIGDTEGEETDTAPEAEAETDQQRKESGGPGKDGDGSHSYGDYVTRCICGFIHDDGYMIECDRCKVWQHVRCVIRNRKVPDDYMCEECDSSKVCDRQRARALQQQWMRDIQERDAKEREVRMRKDNLLHQNNHGQQSQHSDTDSSDNEGVGGVRMVNVGVSGVAAGTAKRRKDSTATRRQARGGAGGARAKRKERKLPAKRNAKNSKNQAQNEALSNALAVVSAQLSEADKLPQLRQWIENYEEAVTNHYSPELRARVSSIRVNGAHSDLGKVEPNVHKCKVQSVPPGVKCLVATCALQANTPVVELRGKYMLSTQHKANNNITFNNHGVVSRNYRPPGPFLFFHKVRDTTEVCVDTRTYGNSARFIRRSCTPNAHLRHVIEKGTLHLYIVTERAVSRGDELTIAHDDSHDQLTANQLLEMPCACAQPATCTLAQRVTVKREAGEKVTGPASEGRKRRGRYSRDSVGAAVAPPEEEPLVTVKTEIKEEELIIKEEPKEDVKEEIKEEISDIPEISPPSPVKKDKKEPTQHFAKSASDFLLENQQRNNNKTRESIDSDITDYPPANDVKTEEKTETEDNKGQAETITKVVAKIKEEAVSEATVITRSTTKKETTQDVKTEEEDEDDDDDSPRPQVSSRRASAKHSSDDKESKDGATSVLSSDDPKKLNREDRKLLAIMKAIERMERQEQRKQEHQAKQAAHRRESDPGTALTIPCSTAPVINAGGNMSTTNSNSNSNDGLMPVKTMDEDVKDEGTPSRIGLKRRKRKGRARTVSTNTRRNRLDSVDSVHSSDDTLQSPPISGTTSPIKQSSSLLLSLASNSNSQSSCKSPERPPSSQPTTPLAPPIQPLLSVIPTMQHQHHITMDNCLSSNSNSAHSSPEATPPPPMSSACLLVAAAMEPLESAAAAAAAAAGVSTVAGGFKFPKTKKGLMNEWLLTKNDTIQSASSISPSSLQPHLPLSSNNCINTATAPTSPIATYSCSKNQQQQLSALAVSYCSGGGVNGNGGNGGSAKKRWLRQAISEDQCDSPPLVEAAVPPPKKRRIPQVEIVSPQRHEDDLQCAMESESTLQELASEMRQEYGTCTISTSPPISMDTSPDISNTSTTTSAPIINTSTTASNSLIVASELIAAALTIPESQPAAQPPAAPSRALLDPRLAPRLNSEQLVGTVEKTLSFLGFDQGDQGVIPGSATPSPVACRETKRIPEVVTPAKRKLSITEYRQRKKLNVNDRSNNDEVLNVEENSSSHSPQEGPLRNRSNSSSSATSGVSTDLDELATPSVTTDPKGALTAFNSEPTELEKQRELGSLRLKKAFGLSLVDDNRKSTALNVEKILKGDLPEPIKSSVSLASPTFPIPGSADLPTLAAVHQQQKSEVVRGQSPVNSLNHVPSTIMFDHAESPPSTSSAIIDANAAITANTQLQSTTSLDSNVEDAPLGDNHETKTPDDDISTEDINAAKIEERLLHVIPLVLPTVNSNRIAAPSVCVPSLTDNLPEVKIPIVQQVDPSVSAKTELFYTLDDLEEREDVCVEVKTKPRDTEAMEQSVRSDICAVTTSYVPPFNNPLYPSTDYTSYGSVIDDEGPYAGRNPSPPPNMDDS